jgi:integrase
MTLKTLAEKSYVRFWERSKSPDTHASNVRKLLDTLGRRRDIREINTEELEDACSQWLNEGLSEKTCNRRLAALSRMLTWAEQRGWIERRPFIERFKESKGRLRWQTDEEEAEMVRLLEAANHSRFARLVVFLAETGLRRGEALGLTWDNVDFDKGWIRLWVTKGGEARSVPMTAKSYAILVELRDDIEFTYGWGVEQGPFLSVKPSTFTAAWNAAKKKMGLAGDSDFVPHCLRHGFASRLIQAGVSLVTVKELMGHAKLETTLIYAHLAPANLADAMAVFERSRNG